MAYHHRTATIALALALAAGVPAAAAAQQLGRPSSPATASPCSEVCSGGGYTSGTTTTPAYSLPIILNNVGNPAPCSEVCSGGGYGPVSQPSWTPDDSGARLPHVSAPRSAVVSSRYNTASVPPAAVRVTHSGGFDWGDAGIGAGGMLALIVIALGGALTLTRRRNHHIHGHTPQNGRSAEKRAADQTV
jgi:hypothetical protein